MVLSLAGTALYGLAGQQVLTGIYMLYLVWGGIVLAWLHYVFSYLARFEAPLKTVLKNSLAILVANLPMSISMVVLFLVAVGGFALHLPASAMLILLLPGMYCWISSYLLERIYQKYLPEEPSEP